MARDYFTVLGLIPGRYDPEEIARRFTARRDRLLVRMLADDDARGCRRELDELHLAYATLRDPRQQREYRRMLGNEAGDNDRVAQLRGFIAATLEDGLLRYSRRQAVLEKARELGFDDFQAQLMIAQVQFGDDQVPVSRGAIPGSSWFPGEGGGAGGAGARHGAGAWLRTAAGAGRRPDAHAWLRPAPPRIWARVAATGVLALAIFLYLVHWVNG